MNQDMYAISSDKAGNTHANTYFLEKVPKPFCKRASIDNIRLFDFFFRRNNIQGAMNNISFKQTQILSEIELFSFQIFL